MNAQLSLTALALIIAVALAFDFINGFHDAANSIATVVSTRVLPPRVAVAWAAFFNFVAAFGFGVAVATTVGTGIVRPGIVDRPVIFAGLAAAILWDVITWYWGLPTSSSHALIAGFAGAGVAKAGPGVLIVPPLIGLVLAAAFMLAALWLVARATPRFVDRAFRRLQLLSAAAYSLGHGTNDAQKTMGIIAVLLFTAGRLGPQFYVPMWVVLLCHFTIGLGTLFGGWRIVRT